MKSNRSRNIGSVSHATMLASDLIPTFLSELESQRPLSRVHRKLVREIKRRINDDYSHDHAAEGCTCNGLGIWNCGMNQDAEDYFGTDDADYDLESLFDALGEYCLPYFYFGAHPGDGSDYGYWLSEDFQDEFADLSTTFAKSNGAYIPDGTNIKVNDLSDVPKGFNGEVLHVNDHGNCTLYAASRGRLREVWAVA